MKVNITWAINNGLRFHIFAQKGSKSVPVGAIVNKLQVRTMRFSLESPRKLSQI